jgi:hypothetical protein
MSKLVSTVAQVIENIRTYNEALGAFADLMPFNRAWYAMPAGSGWLFGPSKFVGYQESTAEKYLQSEYSAERHGRVDPNDTSADPLDGRITERALRRWSERIEEGHPHYEELHTALNELCARFGKKPNALARISIVRSEPKASMARFSDGLVSLMAAVYRELTPAQKAAFRDQIA